MYYAYTSNIQVLIITKLSHLIININNNITSYNTQTGELTVQLDCYIIICKHLKFLHQGLIDNIISANVEDQKKFFLHLHRSNIDCDYAQQS